MRREKYASRLGAVTDRESLEQVIWDADDWTWSPDFDVEDFNPVKVARARQAQVNAAEFEFKVNQLIHELPEAVEIELTRVAGLARAERLAELQAE